MTTAIFTQKGDAYEISVTGHAGYGNGGPDIVCSACSVLACTLLQCALAAEAKGALVSFHAGQEAGGLALSFEPARWARAETDTAVGVIEAGFALLQDKYPGFVRFSPRTGEK